MFGKGPHMSLEKFDYVLALAEERNLTRAAKRTYISQPALTNYINKLESRLGLKLFDRSVTPIQVTAAGALYIERMKKIQLAESNLISELNAMASRETVFHLGIGVTRGSHWLPYLVPEFYRRYPSVVLQLHERGEAFLEDGVRSGEVDLAIGVLNTSYPELTYEKLAEEAVLLAIPRSYPCVQGLSAKQGTPEEPCSIDPAAINGIPFLLPYPGNGFYRYAQSMFTQASISPGRVLSYTNMNTAYQLAAKGIGALFIAPTLFDRFLPGLQDQLAFCRLPVADYPRWSVAGYQPGNKKLPLIQSMIEITREFLNRELPK